MADKDDIAARRARLSAAQRELLESVLRRGKSPEAEGQSIPRRVGTRPVPLTFAQQRLWFLHQFDPGSPAYNISRKFTLKGPADLHALERSLNAVVERHEALRTDFQVIDGEPSQVIVPHRPFAIPLTDLSGLPGPVRASEVQRLASEQARSAFTLERGPLLRASLLRLAADEHVLLLTMHHIISDGWSMGVLFRELAALYAAFAAGESPELPPLPVQYADYALWQRQRLQNGGLAEQLSYWKQQLAGAQPVLELPTTKGRSTADGRPGGRLSAPLGKPLSDALRAFSTREGVTLFMTLVAAFKSLLWRYTGQAEIVVGTPTANRNHPNLEGLIGFFVNTLVLRTRVSGEASFAALLQDVRQICLDAYAHQDVPFEKLVKELQPERSLSDTPFFRVMFALENASGESLHLRGLEIETEAVNTETAIFDLTLYVEERRDELTVTLQYNSELFDEATITRLLTHYRRALESHIENPGRALNETPLLSAAEREQLLSGWNRTRREYPAHSCIHELFEAQAAASPEGMAVIYEDERLTYRELNRHANQLGHYLQELGVEPDARVGLLLERSPALVTTLLAVLKAGGAYLPLSPDYPPQRLGLMIEDADAKLLITERRLASRLPPTKARLLFLEDALQEAAKRPSSSPESAATAENLAYVIYTSGSTGTPKGVMVTHRNVARLVKGADYAELNAGETLLQFAPVSFDASTFEIWGALLNGARLAVFAPGMPSVAELCAGLRRYGVTTLWLTAGLFHQVVELQLEGLQGLRQLLAGGDVLSLWHVREALRGLEGVRLVNGYGPTEGTTFTCCHVITDVGDTTATVPIGRPIANTRVYVLDEGLRLLPVGAAGELYVGGDGLARGYLNRPELTAERFVPDPFSTEPGARLYRAGDRVRWLEGGVLEFLGRTDSQVKLRGFRIELGEVEAALCSHPSVREAVVLLRENVNGDKRLVAYLVTEAERAVASTVLRDFLKSKLPDYMVPSSYVMLERLPLTPNGKVDRRALPEVDGEAAAGAHEYVAPRAGTEQLVAAIWEQVLERERVGARDNFFELGGHSLLATRVVSQLRKAFGVEIALRSLFENPTVAEMSGVIAATIRGDAPDDDTRPRIERGLAAEPMPLSFAQRRLWFLDRLSPGSPTYNVPLAYRLSGHLDAPALLRALRELVRRHESLRTRFDARADEPAQVICGPEVFEPEVVDLSALPEREVRAVETAMDEAVRPFDLARGPVFRALLLRLSDEAYMLVLNAHHIATDGWSVGVLMGELATLYEAYRCGADSPLEDPPVRYADFAAWQRRWMEGEVLEGQLRYWRAQLAGAPAALELPADFVRPHVQSFAGATLRFNLGVVTSRALRGLCAREGVTMFMALLASYAALLGRYSQQDEVLIGTPVANRADAELEQVVGFFANTLALRVRLDGDPTFRELLGRARETCLGAYAHQDVPFERLVEELRVERDLSRSPLFQAMLVYHAGDVLPIELPGLTLTPATLDPPVAKFDLGLAVNDAGGELSVSFNYSTALFSDETAARMASHFVTLLEAIVADEGARVADLPLMREDEVRRIVEGWNDTAADLPAGLRLHELFEHQARATPEAVAVVFEGRTLSYSQLDERANRLARRLRLLGIGPDVLVGVCAERSLEMVVALLGVLKAGGAYVPLDPSYPRERLAFMLEDAHAPVLLTQSHLVEGLPGHGALSLCLDAEWGEAEEGVDFDSGVGEMNLAYVIYTSGSTGRPKGAMNTHRGICNRLLWMQSAYGLGPSDCVLQKTSFSFDVSVWEFFLPLVVGARLVLARPEGHKDPVYLARLINEEGVTTLHFVPSMLETFIESGALAQCAGLRRVICSGEALPSELRRRFFEVSRAELHNLYGPTEASIDVTSWACAPGDGDAVTVPIGRPIMNTQIYLLDERLRPVPVGVPGELFIGGDGLARGYLHRPALTAERFIPDPFSKELGARLYRTGDLARYLAGGEIEFLGRLDHQVKVRGFRIELGEVEAALAQHPQVGEAVAVVRDDARGDRRIVAYYVARDGADAADLRAHLRGRLPEYMIPAAFVRLDAMPLTPNGKVDRRALPEVDGEAAGVGRQYVAPREGTEQLVAAIWEQVLLCERVGARDNFFELGGHSLLATRVVSHVRKQFGVELSLRRLFDAPTVEALACEIERARAGGEGAGAAQPIRKAPREGRRPPTGAAGD